MGDRQVPGTWSSPTFPVLATPPWASTAESERSHAHSPRSQPPHPVGDVCRCRFKHLLSIHLNCEDSWPAVPLLASVHLAQTSFLRIKQRENVAQGQVIEVLIAPGRRKRGSSNYSRQPLHRPPPKAGSSVGCNTCKYLGAPQLDR